MKNASFTTTYISNVKFDEGDLAEFITQACEGTFVSFEDKTQFDDIMNKVSTSLKDYFKSNNFELIFKGYVKSSNYYKFEISNSLEKIELSATNAFFKTHFTIK